MIKSPSCGSGEPTVTTGSAVAIVSMTPTITYGVRRNTQPEASANALATQQFDNVAILLQHARPATVMQAGARHAGYTGEQRRNGK
ncbi:hypothetical protein ECZU23_51040 [Escherichia coli]|nr:hypothetical protein ECZU23_51040 [Escherichia coli]